MLTGIYPLLVLVWCCAAVCRANTFAGVLEAGGVRGTGIPADCVLIFRPMDSVTVLEAAASSHRKNKTLELLLKPDIVGEYVVECPSAETRLYIAVQFPIPGGRASPVELMSDVFTPNGMAGCTTNYIYTTVHHNHMVHHRSLEERAIQTPF